MGKKFAVVYLSVAILGSIFDFATIIIYQIQYPPSIHLISSLLNWLVSFPLNYLVPVSPLLQGLVQIPFLIYFIEIIFYFILGSILGWLYEKIRDKDKVVTQ